MARARGFSSSTLFQFKPPSVDLKTPCASTAANKVWFKVKFGEMAMAWTSASKSRPATPVAASAHENPPSADLYIIPPHDPAKRVLSEEKSGEAAKDVT